MILAIFLVLTNVYAVCAPNPEMMVKFDPEHPKPGQVFGIGVFIYNPSPNSCGAPSFEIRSDSDDITIYDPEFTSIENIHRINNPSILPWIVFYAETSQTLLGYNEIPISVRMYCQGTEVGCEDQTFGDIVNKKVKLGINPLIPIIVLIGALFSIYLYFMKVKK